MRINKSLIAYTPTTGTGSGSVTSVGFSATVPTGLSASISGSPITSAGTIALSLSFAAGYAIPTTIKQSNWDDAYTFVVNFPSQTGNNGRYLTTDGSALSWAAISGTNITGAAISTANDTNVQISASGNTSNALLRTLTLTAGWTGSLAAGRGGTGTSGVTGIMLGNATAAVTGITGIGGQILRANPSTGVYEFWTPTYMQNPMSALGQIIYSNAGGAPVALNANSTANNMYLRSVSSGTPSWASIQGGDIVGAGISRTNDTNVQITLGGATTDGLLRAVTLTMGWTGQLSVPRGGTGASALTGVVIGNSTGAMTAVAGTANQLLRRNALNTDYEFWTPTYMANVFTTGGDLVVSNSAGAPLRLPPNVTTTRKYLSQIGDGTFVTSTTWETVAGGGGITGTGTTNYVTKWTTGGSVLGNSLIQDNGTNVGIGINPSHKLDVDGNIGISGTIYGGKSGNFNLLYDNQGNIGIYVGNATSAYNQYNNTSHFFGNKTGSAAYTTLDSSGARVYGKVVAGSDSSTNGSIILQDSYSNGNLTNIGSSYSSGAPVIGFAVTPSVSAVGAFLSATGLTSYPRGALVVADTLKYYSGAGQTVAIGSAVSCNSLFEVLTTGQMKLTSYSTSTSFTGTAAGYLAFNSSGNVITVPVPTGGSAPLYRIDFNTTMPDTWSNMPSAISFYDGSAAFITAAELSNFTQVRLLINKLGTAGATGSAIILRYNTTYTQNANLWSAIGTTSVQLAVNNTNQFLETAWIDLVAGAKADVFIALMGSGGDGAADPIFGMITAEFR